MLTGLSHRAVGGGNHEDGAVHLSRTGDHVLDVIGVAGGINVSVVTLLGLVLNVGHVDGNATLTLLGSVVHLVERGVHVEIRVLLRQNLGDSGGGRRLSVIDVTDGADIHMRLGLVVLGLSHLRPPGTLD